MSRFTDFLPARLLTVHMSVKVVSTICGAM